MSTIVRYAYAALGALMLTLGVIGFVLPVMPGTVFLLVAAWAFARSVPAVHRWLHGHRWFGPALRRWERERCVDRRTKWLASAMLGVSAVAGSAALAHRPAALVAVLTVMGAVLAYLHTRNTCRAHG
ncbi:MAG: YbaN family protein [Desulfomicrobium escambiense]|nr:YbaN family protein [Desulfomicrobium escambiense]